MFPLNNDLIPPEQSIESEMEEQWREDSIEIEDEWWNEPDWDTRE